MNNEEQIIKDLEKLGQELYRTNDSFKFALEQRLRAKAQPEPIKPIKKLFLTRWAWATVPATLLLFVMLAEAAEYAGIELKPYQYVKTTAVPAVTKQIKLASKAVVEEVAAPVVSEMVQLAGVSKKEKKLAYQTEKVPTSYIISMSPEITAESPLKPETIIQLSEDFKEAAKAMPSYSLSWEAELTKPSISSQPLLDSQLEKLTQEVKLYQEKIEKVPSFLQSTYAEEPQPKAEQFLAETTVAKAPAETMTGQTSLFKKDIYTTPQEIIPEKKQIISAKEGKEDYAGEKTEPQSLPLPIQKQSVSDSASTIYVPKTVEYQPEEKVEIKKEPVAAADKIAEKAEITCQNKTSLTLKVDDWQYITQQVKEKIKELNLAIDKLYSYSKSTTIKLTVSADQYSNLAQSLQNLTTDSSDFKEKIYSKSPDCQETALTIYINKKTSFWEWLIPSFKKEEVKVETPSTDYQTGDSSYQDSNYKK